MRLLSFAMCAFAGTLAFSSLLAAAALADDGSFVSGPEDRFTIGISPATWAQTAPTSPAMKWAAVKFDGTKMATVRRLDDVGEIDFSSPDAQQAFDTEYLKSIEETKVKGAVVTFDGRPAYRLITKGVTNGRPSSRVTIALPADDRGYIISGLSIVSDADADGELNSVLKSFHAIRPPSGSRGWGGGGWATATGVPLGAAVIMICLRLVLRWARSD